MRNRLILGCAAIVFSSFALLANADGQHSCSSNDQANKEECGHNQMAKFQVAGEQN